MKKHPLFFLLLIIIQSGHCQIQMLPNGRKSDGIILPLGNFSQKHSYALDQKREGQLPNPKRPSNSKFLLKIYAGSGLLSPGSYRIQSTNHIKYIINGNYRDSTILSQGEKGIGGGIRFGGGMGLIINDFLNFGVDFEYQKGTKLRNTLVTSIDQAHYDSTFDKMRYNAMTLTPHIIFKALAKPKYFIYNKLGVMFTLPYTISTSGVSNAETGDKWPPGPGDTTFVHNQRIYDGQYKISFGVGFNVALGISINLNDKFRLFGELFGNFSALTPSSSVFNSVNDQIIFHYGYQPPRLDESIEHNTSKVKYNKGGATTSVQDSFNMIPPNSYATYSITDKRFRVNMNSIGINGGITYRF